MVVRVDHVTSVKRCPLRIEVIYGDEGYSWEGRRYNCKVRTVDCLIKRLLSDRSPVISYPGEPGGMVDVEVAKHDLIVDQ